MLLAAFTPFCVGLILTYTAYKQAKITFDFYRGRLLPTTFKTLEQNVTLTVSLVLLALSYWISLIFLILV